VYLCRFSAANVTLPGPLFVVAGEDPDEGTLPTNFSQLSYAILLTPDTLTDSRTASINTTANGYILTVWAAVEHALVQLDNGGNGTNTTISADNTTLPCHSAIALLNGTSNNGTTAVCNDTLWGLSVLPLEIEAQFSMNSSSGQLSLVSAMPNVRDFTFGVQVYVTINMSCV